MRRLIAVLTCLSLIAWWPAEAQTPAEFSDGIAALEGRDRDVMKWDFLGGCGPAGAAAIAQALFNTRDQTDGEFISGVNKVAGDIRAPIILDKAADVVADPGATQRARIAAMLTLLRQLREGFSTAYGWHRVMDVSAGGKCPFGVTSGWPYRQESQLPADSLMLVASALENAMRDQGAPPGVREAAKCARRMISGMVPFLVTPEQLRITYVCGRRFRVDNHGEYTASTTYEVIGTSESGPLGIRPDEPQYVTMLSDGAVRLLYNGAAVMTADNEQTTCP